MEKIAYTFKIKKDVPSGYWYSHLAGMEITVTSCENSDLALARGLPDRVRENYYLDVRSKDVVLKEHCEE